jgi:hypothetical protein
VQNAKLNGESDLRKFLLLLMNPEKSEKICWADMTDESDDCMPIIRADTPPPIKPKPIPPVKESKNRRRYRKQYVPKKN